MKRIISVFCIVLLLGNFINLPILSSSLGNKKVEAATLILKEKKISIYVDEIYSFSIYETSAKIKWSTSNEEIATVSSEGKIKGIKQGTAKITATIGSIKSTCSVTVNNCKISADALELEIASNMRLSILGASSEVIWESSDNMVASITKDGLVTGRLEGKVRIIGKYNNVTYQCYVTIKNRRLHASVTELTCYEDTTVAISVQDLHSDETLQYEVADKNIVSCSFGNLAENSYSLNIKLKKYGATTITVTSKYSTEKLVINVTTVDKTSNSNNKLTAEEIYEKYSSTTVQINTDLGIGSGFFIDNGKIVTNYHVIQNAKKIEIQLQNGSKYDVDYVLGFSEKLDIAILSIPIVNDKLAVNKHGNKSGETIYAIGSSLGLADTFTNGIISNTSRFINSTNYIQINAAITHGNSGGPLINSYGEVIGINTLGMEDGQNLNFAVNINQLYQVNTGSPMTVTKFYESEIIKLINKEIKNVIIEDHTLGNGISGLEYCQELPQSEALIKGDIDSGKDDFYKITLTQSHSFTLIAGARDNYDGNELFSLFIMKKTGNQYKVLMDTFINCTVKEVINGVPIIKLNKTLTAGVYYIGISARTSTSVPYFIKYIPN